ncbi:MAG: hypothetical protein IPM38_01890 [Ignavibacteria bacterium]|nr:hypothetical protein [Ignavibacteria bacterium]
MRYTSTLSPRAKLTVNLNAVFAGDYEIVVSIESPAAMDDMFRVNLLRGLNGIEYAVNFCAESPR